MKCRATKDIISNPPCGMQDCLYYKDCIQDYVKENFDIPVADLDSVEKIINLFNQYCKSFLKKCPFCGKQKSTKLMLDSDVDMSESNGQVVIVCDIYKDGCGVSSRYGYTIEEVIDNWNKRNGVNKKDV